MAEKTESHLSLQSLEDELTCSICLSPFDCPVTLPCGHNFCQDCILTTWKESYSCPQCRTLFLMKPDLKKNTVLSTVVKTFLNRTTNSEPSVSVEEGAVGKAEVGRVVEEEAASGNEEVILCDMCSGAKASHTCLTCMASYCDEHLRPHLENPIFRVHRLTRPMAGLMGRICLDHQKLMDVFCTQHVRLICSLCIQQNHKTCTLISPEEQQSSFEFKLRENLGLLSDKLLKNERVISQLSDINTALKDTATNKKKTLACEYQQMREMLDKEERIAMNVVDQEVERGHIKLKVLETKFSENVNTLTKAKEDLQNLLTQSQTKAFQQVSLNLPQAANFEPYTPRINLDSKEMIATQAFATNLKDHINKIVEQPVAARLPMLKTGVKPAFASEISPLDLVNLQASGSSVQYPTDPGVEVQKNSQTKAAKKKSQKQAKKALQSSMENLSTFSGKDQFKHDTKEGSDTSKVLQNITHAQKRSELLKYGTILTLDPKTAHKRITLTEDYTKATVSDEPANYPDCPERFAVCSQVLASKGFARGRHYWEVRLSSNNFLGIGLAYSSIDRKGPSSRLGRNDQSWCVEWFNVKLSAWHNSSEAVLPNPNPKRVGVLLDCEQGCATFYNVADRAYPFHTFVLPLTVAVYPAFWMFSSGSSISLCKLQA